jgi:(1->4)-alpha-D-glucan 1-alpha-D-glucosylmutase
VAAEEINYRRFFDVNSLAAIRMELPEVFDATHRLVFDLIARGAIMASESIMSMVSVIPQNTSTTCSDAFAKSPGRHDCDRPLYLLVEKILIGDERLPKNWPVHGTTGYDFTNEVVGLAVDPSAESSITDSYRKFLGDPCISRRLSIDPRFRRCVCLWRAR